MAKIVDTLPARQGRPAVHAWDEYFDGKVRMLVQGEDFDAKPQSFRNAAAHAARQRNYSLATRIVDGAVYLGPAKEDKSGTNGDAPKSSDKSSDKK